MSVLNARTIYDAFKPMYYFSKTFGFWLNSYKVIDLLLLLSINLQIARFSPICIKRSDPEFSIGSLIHLILMSLIYFGLLIINANPESYHKATNSHILNYGLWSQTTISMGLGKFMVCTSPERTYLKKRSPSKLAKSVLFFCLAWIIKSGSYAPKQDLLVCNFPINFQLFAHWPLICVVAEPSGL